MRRAARRPAIAHSVIVTLNVVSARCGRQLTQAFPSVSAMIVSRRVCRRTACVRVALCRGVVGHVRKRCETFCARHSQSGGRVQRRRAERSQLERWRIQLAAEARSQWRSYQRALEQKPLRTKALTSFYGLVLADVIAQAADPGSYDVMRTARMGAFGLAWHGVSVRPHFASTTLTVALTACPRQRSGPRALAPRAPRVVPLVCAAAYPLPHGVAAPSDTRALRRIATLA